MNPVGYAAVNAAETFIRMVPVPCRTGLVKIGNPGPDSPVFLTCNYHLTVERVKRALGGTDCYLLVADSKGYNVWCGAAGGHFNNHGVVSVLKTSGIEDLVNHRRVVLPQLAATGIESSVVRKKTGWEVIWGPVCAKDITSFTKNGVKTPEMKKVGFPLSRRMEMAVMWAFPFSAIADLAFGFFRHEMLLPVIVFIWLFSLSAFAAFPLYSGLLVSGKKHGKRKAFTEFGRIPLILWGISMAVMLIFGALFGKLTPWFVFLWGPVSFVAAFVMGLDMKGNTPTYKSGTHEDRLLTIFVDEGKCKGDGICTEICPKDCYEIREDGAAKMVRADSCVQCGACVIQCPFDALYFKDPEGGTVPPESIRRFKLNLMGKRVVRTDGKG